MWTDTEVGGVAGTDDQLRLFVMGSGRFLFYTGKSERMSTQEEQLEQLRQLGFVDVQGWDEWNEWKQEQLLAVLRNDRRAFVLE